MISMQRLRWFPALAMLPLAGCGARVFEPADVIARAEYHYTLLNTGLVLLIVLPSTVATCVFAWRYRKSRGGAYDPGFSHSLSLELLMWGIPLVIVVILAFSAYASVFAVNPAAPRSLGPATDALEVDVVTTDWQWLFIYPQLRIATIDDLVVPQGKTVKLQLTSATVVNDFYIPQIAPMIDVMPGMRTLDAFRVDQPGAFEGFSADFSGAGFSWMQFATRILPPADFAAWVKQTQSSGRHLDMAEFQRIAQPTINRAATPQYFSNADPNLFREVYDDVRDGEVFPVPMEVETKSPATNPLSGGKTKS